MKREQVTHWTIGGLFEGRGHVIYVGRNTPLCPTNVHDPMGRIDIKDVTCKRCLHLSRVMVRVGDGR